MFLYVYIYMSYIYSPICPLYTVSYLSSPLYIPRWPVLGSGTNNAGQLTAIHTTCRGVARLVLLRHATGRAIRSTRTTSRASGREKSCNCRTTGESYDQLYDNEGPPGIWPQTIARPSHDKWRLGCDRMRLLQSQPGCCTWSTTSLRLILVVRISKTNHD